jgi:hypothetical protein
VDLLRLDFGIDFFVTRFAHVGGIFDWSFGCFYERRREYEDGRTIELDETCKDGPPYASMGLGIRAGLSVE